MAAARRIAEGVDYVRDGRWKTWGPMLLIGPRRPPRDARARRPGAHRRARWPSAPRLRHARGLLSTCMRREDLERSLGFDLRRRWTRCWRRPTSSACTRRSTPETHHLMNRETLRRDEADRDPDQHLARAGGGHRRAGRGAARRRDRRGGAGRDRARAAARRPPLVTMPNCIVVPHIASASHATRGKMAQIAAEQPDRWPEGRAAARGAEHRRPRPRVARLSRGAGRRADSRRACHRKLAPAITGHPSPAIRRRPLDDGHSTTATRRRPLDDERGLTSVG